MSEKENKLYKVTADYRKNNHNKPHYYVRAETVREAEKRFRDIISWLDIYGIEICDDSVADEILSEPMKHNII